MPKKADSVKATKRPLLPVSEFLDAVQDLGDVLYDLPEQAPTERYIDYAHRIESRMALLGWRFVKVSETR